VSPHVHNSSPSQGQWCLLRVPYLNISCGWYGCMALWSKIII